MSGRSRIEILAERRAQEVGRAVAGDLRRALDDAGLRQAAVARAARVSPDMISRILRGERQASFETLARIALALGGDISVRVTPGVGIPIHDRVQARMVDAFLLALHPRWASFLEVPVRTPARGAIDLVLADSIGNALVAAEFQSQVRRAEQVIRWSNEKAVALASTDLARMATVASAGVRGGDPVVSRLLVLRSTSATRAVVRSLPALFDAAYPVRSSAAVEALRHGTTWPGAALVWMDVRGREARLMDGCPRDRRMTHQRV